MKKKLLVVLFSLCLTGLFANGQDEGTKSVSSNELSLYIWTEYMDPALIEQFETEFGCEVLIDYYESNEEMLAKLQAGGTSQYDIAVPSDYIMVNLMELDLIQPLDKSVVNNISNLSENFIDPPYDPSNAYSAGYQWGTVGFVYNKEKLGDFGNSWSAIFENSKDLTYMLFDSEREQIGIALAYLGYSINTLEKEELQAAADLLIEAKQSEKFLGFEGNVGARNKVVAGTLDMAMAYNGDAMGVIYDHPEIGFVNPVEGTVIWVDSMVIPKKAPNAELANKFIEFMLRPEVAAQLSNYNHYATPNGAALPMILPEDLANPVIYPDPETQKKLQYIEDLGKNNRVYSELWQMVKTR